MKKIQETIESPPIEVSEQRERKRSRTPPTVPVSAQETAKPVEAAPVTVEKAAAPVETAPAPVVKAPEPVEKAAEASVVQEKPAAVVAPKADSPAPKKKEGK